MIHNWDLENSQPINIAKNEKTVLKIALGVWVNIHLIRNDLYDSWILTATTTEVRNRDRIIYCQLGTEKNLRV